jgi:hypothetical protein
MDQQPPSKIDQFLDQNYDKFWNPETGLPSFPQRQFDSILDHIEAPDIGLAWLAKRPAKMTPEQALSCLFWQNQFTEWRNWLAGDELAVWRALMASKLGNKEAPIWAVRAVYKLSVSPADRRARDDMENHCWRALAKELVRGRVPGHPLNYERPVRGDDVDKEAAKLAAEMGIKGGADAVHASCTLINNAMTTWNGFQAVTLQSYKDAVRFRDRNRPKQRDRNRSK